MPKEIKSYKCKHCGDLVQSDGNFLVAEKIHIKGPEGRSYRLVDVEDEVFCTATCISRYVAEQTKQDY